MKTDIFNDFEPLSKKQWTDQATRELKGKDFEQTLVSKTEDGIIIQPYYALEDIESEDFFKPFRQQIQKPQQFPGMDPRYWSNLHLVVNGDDRSENRKLLHALNNGANGLILDLTGTENLDILLDQVAFEYIDIYLKLEEPSVAIYFFEWCKSKKIDKLIGGLHWDPIIASLYHKTSKERVLADALTILKATANYPDFKIFCINGAYLHNTGATGVLELKYSVGAYIELLDLLTDSGQDIHTLFKKTIVLTAAGSDYFYEIAKIRSYKVIINWLAQKYGVQLDPKIIFLSGETSSWTKTLLDVPTNMLRNTTEAMACILGGCEGFYVQPHDGIANDRVAYSERIARNVSNILLEEAYFGKVVDPVAGSYYVETLIRQITDNAKKALIELEDAGGWWTAYEKGEIQSEIKSVRKKRTEAILTQQQIKVGVNKYEEKFQVELINKSQMEEAWQLLPSRETELFETQNTPKA